MDCLPESLAGKRYYRPTERGFEKEIKRRLDGWEQDQEAAPEYVGAAFRRPRAG